MLGFLLRESNRLLLLSPGILGGIYYGSLISSQECSVEIYLKYFSIGEPGWLSR